MSNIIGSALLVPAVIALSLLVLVLVASYCDISRRRIPNVLTLGGACWGIVLLAATAGLSGLVAAVAGWVVGFAFMIPGYALGKTGAGDVKLLAAVGSYVGPYSAAIAALATMLAGALIAVVVALLGRGESPWRRYALMCRYLVTTGRWSYISPSQGEVMATPFPYAVAIAPGAAVGCWYSLTHGGAATGWG